MSRSEATENASPEVARKAARRARDRANAARWDINVATTLFAVLIVVVILVSQNIRVEIVAPIAVVGLAVAWLMGWRKGEKLYHELYREELARASHEARSGTDGRSQQEVIVDAVQEALREWSR
ncbi:MAG: hypothetical protein V3R87_00770 [Dehalococcoidia bacterium]